MDGSFLKDIGFTGDRLGEIMGFSRAQIYNIIHGKCKPSSRLANGVKAVSRQIELEYEQELETLNERYAKRRDALARLIYDESEEDDEEA
jgi:plasmid maintenance system antidote protein VapI